VKDKAEIGEKRSLQIVNEHFEPLDNEVFCHL
jgi:hypothetical protein